MTPRSYKLYLQRTLKIWMIIFVLVSVAVPAVLLFLAFNKGEPPVAVAFAIALVFLVVIAMGWYSVLATPHTINVLADQRIELVSLIRNRTVRPSEIRSIRPSSSQLGWLCIRHSDGKVCILHQFSGFHLFLSELSAEHPGVELLGC